MLLRDKIDFGILPLQSFPNGAFWMAHANSARAKIKIRSSAYVVHFTHLKGREKQRKMIEYRMWHSNSEKLPPAIFGPHRELYEL